MRSLRTAKFVCVAASFCLQGVRITAVSAIFAISGMASLSAGEQIDCTPRPVKRIAPGTVVDRRGFAGSTHLILLAKPRVGAGDVDDTPSLVRKYAAMFPLAVLAEVSTEEAGETTRFRLDQLAIGLCASIGGRNTVVSSDTHEKLGASLDFVAERVLAESERNLDEVVQVARHSSMCIFDAEAVVLRNGEHCHMVVRYMVWIDPATGKPGTLVWLLEKHPQQGYRMAQNTLQVLPRNFVQDRVIHVDSRELTLGIPSKKAFALVDIPQGRPVPVTAELARWASKKRLTPSGVRKLTRALQTAFEQQRVDQTSR